MGGVNVNDVDVSVSLILEPFPPTPGLDERRREDGEIHGDVYGEGYREGRYIGDV